MPAQLQLYFYRNSPAWNRFCSKALWVWAVFCFLGWACSVHWWNKQTGRREETTQEWADRLLFQKRCLSSPLHAGTQHRQPARFQAASFFLFNLLLSAVHFPGSAEEVGACLPPPPSTSCCTNCHGLLCFRDAHECSDFLVLHNMEEFNYIKANHPRTTLVSFRNSKVELGKVHIKCTYQHSSQITQHPICLPAPHLPAQTTTEVSAVSKASTINWKSHQTEQVHIFTCWS